MTDEQQIDLEAYRAAREARNFEITLFWQTSNYFLVLNTSIAVGVFALHETTYRMLLSVFGLVVSALWIRINLGSKFWQSRWEHRLNLTELKLRSDLNVFSADATTVRSDVQQSLLFWERKSGVSMYGQLVLRKPSVSFTMMLLTPTFSLFWLGLLLVDTSRFRHACDWQKWGLNMSPEHSAAIQAITSIMSVLVVVAALVVAYRALLMSQHQVETAQEQVEATLRPVVVLQTVNGDIQLKNVGNGPAINLRREDSDGKMQGRNVFPVGDTATVTDQLTGLVFASLGSPFNARYETLSGQKRSVTAHRDRNVTPEGFRLQIRKEN